jgi:hypothetical protein
LGQALAVLQVFTLAKRRISKLLSQNCRTEGSRFGKASLFLFLLAGFLVSCATRPVPRAAGGSDNAASGLAVPSPPSPSAIDRLVRRVKDNDPGLAKYYLQDEQGRIAVKAEAEGCEILYDLSEARPVSPSLWEVGFSVRQEETGEVRRDTLLWNIPRDDSGILLSLDDNYEDQWRSCFDLFDRYGVKLTFFVIGSPSPFVPRP